MAPRRLWLSFRSLFVLSHSTSELEGVDCENKASIPEDLRDVLAVVEPINPCIMPLFREKLRPHAEKLGLSTRFACSPIPRQGLLSLLKLLLSIAVDEPKWDNKFRTAHLLSDSQTDLLEGSADTLLARFTSSEKRIVEWKMFKDVLTTYVVTSPQTVRI